jgi:hypothetical protein
MLKELDGAFEAFGFVIAADDDDCVGLSEFVIAHQGQTCEREACEQNDN